MKTSDTFDNNVLSSVETVISKIKKKDVVCCKSQCIKRLLENNEAALRIFLEEWFQLDKKQKEAVLRFSIRLCSRWSECTARGANRKLNRFKFEDPILGSLCRKAFADIIDIGEATLARHTATVHASDGRFLPLPHQNKGKTGHRQTAFHVRGEIISFFVEIASAVGEESPGRHSQRDEEKNIHKTSLDTADAPVVFLPAMYSLRLLHHLYREKTDRGHFPTEYRVSWGTFGNIFHSEELSWLRIRSPRDDVCDVCLIYRRKMAELLRKEGSKTALEKLGGISSDFVKHRDLAIATRKVYRDECKKARDGAGKIRKASENGCSEKKFQQLIGDYEAHYSFDFSQSLWLPQMADTPGQFYFLSLRTVNLFGVVDDGGTGSPLQTNMLYDQTAAGKGSSEVVSMLYYFLIRIRTSMFASKKICFHADNCVGQNKNSTVIQFFIWCVATGIADHIELRFLLKGHTKFSPDGGFGMIKKHYRRVNAYTIEHVADEVRKSTRGTRRNNAIILRNKKFGNWKTALRSFFTPMKGVSSFCIFKFDKKYHLGEVRTLKHEEEKFEIHNLLRNGLRPEEILSNSTFVKLQEYLPPLEQPQMQAKKQWDLYEKVRPYVPSEYQDIVCPQPDIDKKFES